MALHVAVIMRKRLAHRKPFEHRLTHTTQVANIAIAQKANWQNINVNVVLIHKII